MPTHQAISLDASGFDALASRLGDTPETTIAVHLLRRRLCSAYASGDPGRLDAVVIQPSRLPEEPTAYGTDVGAIWSILRGLRGWTCINLDINVACHLGPLMEADLGRAVRRVEDVYHTLDRPVAGYIHPAVRLLAHSTDTPHPHAELAEIERPRGGRRGRSPGAWRGCLESPRTVIRSSIRSMRGKAKSA